MQLRITLNKTATGQTAFFTGGEKKYSVVNPNGLGSTNLGILDLIRGYITDSASCYYPNIDPIVTRPTKTWSNLSNSQATNLDSSSNATIQGDTIQYKIKLSNTGVTPSTNSQIIDQLPLGVEYQLNSTRINGNLILDNFVGATTVSPSNPSPSNSAFPLSNWYNLSSPNQPLGTIFPDTTPNILDNEIEITFQAKVTATTDNTIISNIAQFRSRETPLTTSQNGEGNPTEILTNYKAPPVSSVISSVATTTMSSSSSVATNFNLSSSTVSSSANSQNQNSLKDIIASSVSVVENLLPVQTISVPPQSNLQASTDPLKSSNSQPPPCEKENYKEKQKYIYKVVVGKGKRAKLVTKTGTRTVIKERCKTSKPSPKPVVAKKNSRGGLRIATKKALKKTVKKSVSKKKTVKKTPKSTGKKKKAKIPTKIKAKKFYKIKKELKKRSSIVSIEKLQLLAIKRANLSKLISSFNKLKSNFNFENLSNFLNILPKIPKSNYVAPPKVEPVKEKSWGENIWDFGAGIRANVGNFANSVWNGDEAYQQELNRQLEKQSQNSDGLSIQTRLRLGGLKNALTGLGNIPVGIGKSTTQLGGVLYENTVGVGTNMAYRFVTGKKDNLVSYQYRHKTSAGDQLCGSALVGVACILHNRDDKGDYNFDPTAAPIKTVCGSGYQNINGKDDINIAECAGNSLGIFFGSKINKATKCISQLEVDWWEIGVLKVSAACNPKLNKKPVLETEAPKPVIKPLKLTKAEATPLAKTQGYSPASPNQIPKGLNSHGSPVYKKGNSYISPDNTVHGSGGKATAWKVFDGKGNRTGSLDSNFNRVRD